jgi:tRNA A37 N6-isopentenylltransferase MiaA
MKNEECVRYDAFLLDHQGLDIASNKATEEEKHGIPHHLIGVLDPWRDLDFSSLKYLQMALPVVCATLKATNDSTS